MSARAFVALAVSLLANGCAVAPRDDREAGIVRRLQDAVHALLASLDDAQQQRATCTLDDDEVQRWHFVPGRYAGIELGDLDDRQQTLAHGVLLAMLSRRGHYSVSQIIALEDVLRELETAPGRDVSHRDPGRYALMVAGDPASDTFVVRFQGHHVSLRVAVVGGIVASCTPHFLGSNPDNELLARFPGRMRMSGGEYRVLQSEETLVRDLLRSLDEQQRERAMIAETAPPDVLLGPGKPPAALGERRGLAWTEMTARQRERLWGLIQHYALRLRGELARTELARIEARGLDDVHFALAGSIESGRGFYYRIHADEWAIEYDCTQGDANHVHTVWRDFERDFGGDPLREHLHAHRADNQRGSR